MEPRIWKNLCGDNTCCPEASFDLDKKIVVIREHSELIELTEDALRRLVVEAKAHGFKLEG